MKAVSVIFLLGLFISPALHAEPMTSLPDGEWRGTESRHLVVEPSIQRGDVTVRIENNKIYTHGLTGRFSWHTETSMEFINEQGTVNYRAHDGSLVATGYCKDNVCHISNKEGGHEGFPFTYQETFLFKKHMLIITSSSANNAGSYLAIFELTRDNPDRRYEKR